MQLNEDITLSKLKIRRPKSGTWFPKRLPTYIVAFALKETCDDLAMAQQMICNKRSPQESTNSITPTNSLKMFEGEQAGKLDQILDAPATKTEDNHNDNPGHNELDVSELIELETEIKDISQGETFSYNKSNDTLTEMAIKSYITQNLEEVSQPEVIFNATNYSQKCKQNKFLKKKSKAYKNIKSKCNKFKCKLPKNTISNRLEKYYDKTKRNSVKPGNIQEGFSKISTVVSRTRVLKKVLAKENLLEETELISVTNDSKLNVNDDESISSQTSTTKNEYFVGNSSENTLTEKPSTTSSNNEDVNSISTVQSIIETSPGNKTPYKTDVINVAVAVAYKKTRVNSTDESTIKEVPTSMKKPLSSTMTALTSSIPSEFRKINAIEPAQSNDNSNATFLCIQSSCDIDDRYDMARTSSDFNKISNTSTLTIRNDSENLKDIKSNKMEFREDTNKKQQSLLETVINLGYYPEITPSTSSGGALCSDGLNNVIVTENLNERYPVSARNKGDSISGRTINVNVLKKPFHERSDSPTNKNINLPNQAHINAILNNNGLPQRKYAEESRQYPANIQDMLDKIIVVLDVSLKRLEESVTDKIIKEMKKTIAFELHPQSIPEHDIDLEKGDNIEAIEPKIEDKVTSVQELKENINESLQCDLVQNQVIDQIMLKLSQGPKILNSRSIKSLQKLKPKTVRDYFEVLKPPAVGSRVLADKGDAVTISTINEEVSRFRRMGMQLFAPINFVRENAFIITSVPAFFVVLLFVYGLLMLIAKPW